MIDFLELPAVELCIRASNQIATQQARQESGSIAPVVRFLQAIPKLPPVEWDSLVSNVVNIWIIEKEELNGDRSAASQLVPYIQDERCLGPIPLAQEDHKMKLVDICLRTWIP